MSNKPNRKRNKAITIRLTDEEYAALERQIKKSGLTQQAFIINAVNGATIQDPKQLSNLLKQLQFANSQLRGIATNINQLAHKANIEGSAYRFEINEQLDKFNAFRKENEVIWQQIRSLIGMQKPTGQ